jgi:probable F420-dependent oxidoreductase
VNADTARPVPDVGLHALGIGPGSRPQVLAAVAAAAEQAGFARLWCGEHVVMVDQPASRYPYSDDGRIGVPADADWLDPLLTLAFLAHATSSIRLATGVLLLPEHNPVTVAKQAATLDRLSHGRFDLGVGVGWSAEEFAALGVPFARRGQRTEEYVAAMGRIWRDDPATFHGQFVNFDGIRVNPRPHRAGQIPVIFGGTSPSALERAAAMGDGWYGFNLQFGEVFGRVSELAEQRLRAGRPEAGMVVAVSLRDGDPGQLPALAAAGVTELVIVAAPPEDAAAAADWVRDLADRWIRLPR